MVLETFFRGGGRARKGFIEGTRGAKLVWGGVEDAGGGGKGGGGGRERAGSKKSIASFHSFIDTPMCSGPSSNMFDPQ